MDIPHKCNVLEYCFLNDDNNYKILFCVFCRRVVGYEKDGKRFMRDFAEQQYKRKEYSQETLNNNV